MSNLLRNTVGVRTMLTPHDKYKTCKNCPDRTIEPNCHDSCEGYQYRVAENQKLYDERKREAEFRAFKGHAMEYTKNNMKNGTLKVRRGE